MLTLFHPASGQVRVGTVGQATNAILHPWLKEQLSQILAQLPSLPEDAECQWGRHFRDWGFDEEADPDFDWPLVRLIVVWDHLAGHSTPEMVRWMLSAGIVPLYTPLGGSWLNMAESVQRIIVRRALCGQHPKTAEEIMEWLSATARGWNADPTPFAWGGKRWERRQRFRARHALGGSRAYTRRSIRRTWQSGQRAQKIHAVT